MLGEMRTRFGSQVVYTFRHLVVGQPFGRAAALANEAAGCQGRFWEMHDQLLREAPIESDRQLRRAAARAGLNLRRFEVDRSAAVGASRLDEDVADAAAMQLRQTPTYFIDNVRYDGPIDAESVVAAVARAASGVER